MTTLRLFPRHIRMVRRIVGVFVSMALLVGTLPINRADAATMTQIRLTLSTIAASASAVNGTLQFVIPTGVTENDTILITFDSGFDLGTFALGNYDFEEGSTGTCSSASFADEDFSAGGTADVDEWGLGQSGDILTLTAPSGAATYIAAGRCVQLIHGTSASSEGAGAATWVNPSAGNHDVDITSELGATDDSGSGSVSIITDDSVNVTASVDPYVTFTISDTTIEFGPLSASAATWADDSAGSATDVAAHTMTLSTNADSGYAITYNGATLTAGSETISVATITDDANGTPTTEQFATSFDKTTGDATIAAGYDYDAGPDWNFVASTTTTIVSETGPTATETIEAHYLANIAATTEPGTYSTNITYVASAAF